MIQYVLVFIFIVLTKVTPLDTFQLPMSLLNDDAPENIPD